MDLDFKKRTFEFMLKNFELAAKKMPSDFKSLNWDVFPNGYSDLIKNEEIWPRMLRNALTIGFNDALVSHGNKRFQRGHENLWKEMKQGGLPDLIKEENDQNLFRSITDQVKKLILSTDIEFVASSGISKIGNPVVYETNVKVENTKNYKMIYNRHDYEDIYHS